jgi:hypothetical protein
VKNRFTPLLIGGSGDQAARFVEHQIHLGFNTNRPSIDLDPILPWPDAPFRITLDRTVDAHTPGLDQAPSLASRAMAELGQRSRQADSLVVLTALVTSIKVHN